MRARMVDLDYSRTPRLVYGMQIPVYAAASPQLNAETVATTNRCGAFDQAKRLRICRYKKGQYLLCGPPSRMKGVAVWMVPTICRFGCLTPQRNTIAGDIRLTNDAQ